MSLKGNTKYSCHFSEQKFDGDVLEPSATTVLPPNFQENHQMTLMKTKNPILVLMIRSSMSNLPYRDDSGSDM